MKPSAEFLPSPEQLRLLVGSLRDGVWLWDLETKASFISPRSAELLACPPEKLPCSVETLREFVHPEDWPAYGAAIQELMDTGKGYSLHVRLKKGEAGYGFFHVRSEAKRDPETSAVRFLVGTITDVNEQELTRRLLVGERRVAEMIARRENLADTLGELIRTLELQIPGATCSVLTVDARNRCLRDGAGPGLPAEYRKAVDGAPVGSAVGSCGTAAFRRQVVIVEDIETDPLWADYKHLILPHGYRACWSFPVIDTSGEVLATFAVYRRQPHRPDEAETDLVRRAAHLVGIAVREHQESLLMKQALARLSLSEERLAFHMRQTPLIVLELDAAGAVRSWNPAAEQIFGYSAAEAVGRSFWDLIIPEFAVEKVSRIWHEILSRTGSIHAENENRTKDGRTILCEWFNTHLVDENGRVTGIATIGRDITESRRMVEALRESERRFATVVSATRTGLWDWDLLSGKEFLSVEWKAHIGFKDDELPSDYSSWYDRLHPEDRDSAQSAVEKALADPATDYRAEYRLLHRDGSYRRFYGHGQVFRDAAGRPVRMLGTQVDITEIRAAQEEMLKGTRIHRLSERAAKVGGWEYDLGAKTLYWTEETYRLHEVEPDHYRPSVETAIAFYTPESLPRIRECVRRCIEEQVPYDAEFEIVTAKGRRRPVRSAGLPLVVDGKVVRIYGAFQDISEVRSREVLLRQRDELMRAVAGMARDLLGAASWRNVIGGSLQRLGQAAGVSRAFVFELVRQPDGASGVVQLFRWLAPGISPGDPGAQPDKVYSYEPTFTRWRDLLRGGHEMWGVISELPDEERVQLRALGVLSVLKVPVFVRGVWWGAVGFDDCISERRWSPGEIDALKTAAGILGEAIARENDALERQAFEEKLQETQKLESLGVLAGGIAHDFNNLLTTIIGNASLVREHVAANGEVLPLVGQIEQASRQAAEFCQQMLAYAGKSSFVTRRVDLNALVGETISLLKASLNKKIAFDLNFAAGLPAVVCDVAQVRQVILNLIVNAGDAIGDADGNIRVRTRALEASPRIFRGARVAPEKPEGLYVELVVEDNGCGMSAETMARIFDPFFTTKFTGRGLGLASVLGIVRGHRGALSVTSEPGKGTRFTVLFPASKTAAIGEAKPPPPSAPVPKGRALVVDDEEGIRTVICSMLRRAGYESDTAGDGVEGVGKFRSDPARYQLVLMDLTMPRMDGYEALAELRKISPEVPVYLMSGYDESMSTSRLADFPISGFLQKPFGLDVLRARLSAI